MFVKFKSVLVITIIIFENRIFARGEFFASLLFLRKDLIGEVKIENVGSHKFLISPLDHFFAWS